MDKSARTSIIVCLGFIIAGAVLLVTGILGQITKGELRRDCTAQTEGIVTEINEIVYIEEDTGNEKVSYYPVFKFSVDGEDYEQQSDIGSGNKRFSAGQTVTVFYDPADPWRFYIFEDTSDDFFNIILGCIGGVIMGFGIFGAVRTIRKSKQQKG